ncbi:tRNA (N(6)-L-threonylcarbamoyladenosine(37)-C(2))-methylthiotransferase MtaB [Candidatus Shikimatogenerans silvanidophilus]|uniref:tRNA (N(6)-L-threonylcarbamoyladenosine(37)-C(2))- methylthiotransferase MtaB n=1 Tax=Candidatus Shikimatogenerans silvanidophilus TaxID=2782547 RepID=UPI001BAE409D|nr:tRNA (N(6)-L-threonylcarbamoyladenosine(37)-C(2))-methylthiotransferase MtaB [Candidatus Shikimatogenerans silvanidophilus]
MKKLKKILKFSSYTLGCKLNFSETSTIIRKVSKLKNFKKVDFNKFSDLCIINTCSVTEKPEKELIKIINSLKKKNSKIFIIVIGCYAQLQPKKISKIKEVDLILGNKEKFYLDNYINNFFLKKKKINKKFFCDKYEFKKYENSYSINDRTRSFLKIQDGCNYKCSYCTIPFARGLSRSDKIENVINNIKKIVKNGVKEIVLTGINIGDYNYVENKIKYNFLDLINKIENIKEIVRIRVSSIEPNLFSDEIINFFHKSKKFVQHFHIPLQSGSDEILKKMQRRYLSKFYFKKIEKIKKLMPNSCIGADVIVGFPGETKENFLETYNFIKNLPISYLHVFSFSYRKKTKAEKLYNNNVNNVLEKYKKERRKMLQILSEKKKRFFYEKQLNKMHNVLFEKENKKGWIYGYTENFIRVKSIWKKEKVNKIKYNIKLNKIDKDGIMIL